MDCYGSDLFQPRRDGYELMSSFVWNPRLRLSRFDVLPISDYLGQCDDHRRNGSGCEHRFHRGRPAVHRQPKGYVPDIQHRWRRRQSMEQRDRLHAPRR